MAIKYLINMSIRRLLKLTIDQCISLICRFQAFTIFDPKNFRCWIARWTALHNGRVPNFDYACLWTLRNHWKTVRRFIRCKREKWKKKNVVELFISPSKLEIHRFCMDRLQFFLFLVSIGNDKPIYVSHTLNDCIIK